MACSLGHEIMEKEPDIAANVRRARYARANHRARQHADAHAEGPGNHPIIDKPDVPRSEPVMVTTTEQLSELLAHLRSAGSFAYDSEFIGELTYVPKLCLVQVATTSRLALIDPLPGLDLKPFWEIVADESVEKITHAGEQDVEPVIRHLGREAKKRLRHADRLRLHRHGVSGGAGEAGE